MYLMRSNKNYRTEKESGRKWKSPFLMGEPKPYRTRL
nr:MAG TPA: hypothetical protein [Caudoviricetes sp.]